MLKICIIPILAILLLLAACGPASPMPSPPSQEERALSIVSQWDVPLTVKVTQYQGEAPPCRFRGSSWHTTPDWTSSTNVAPGGSVAISETFGARGDIAVVAAHWFILASTESGEDVWCRVLGAGTSSLERLGWKVTISPEDSWSLKAPEIPGTPPGSHSALQHGSSIVVTSHARGSWYVVHGSGWEPGEHINLELIHPGGSVGELPSVVADQNGAFSIEAIHDPLPEGEYQVQAVGERGTIRQAPLLVVPATTPAGPTPTFILTPPPTPTPPAASGGASEREEDAAALDYAMAIDPDMDMAEAKRRANLMEEARATLDAIRAEVSEDILAGFYWEHKPDLRVHLRLTDDPSPTLKSIIDESPVPIIVSTDAAVSLSESQRRLDRARPGLQEALPELMIGIWIDERTAEVVLEVFVEGDPEQVAEAKSRLKAAAESLAQETDLPVRIRYLPAPPTLQ